MTPTFCLVTEIASVWKQIQPSERTTFQAQAKRFRSIANTFPPAAAVIAQLKKRLRPFPVRDYLDQTTPDLENFEPYEFLSESVPAELSPHFNVEPEVLHCLGMIAVTGFVDTLDLSGDYFHIEQDATLRSLLLAIKRLAEVEFAENLGGAYALTLCVRVLDDATQNRQNISRLLAASHADFRVCKPMIDLVKAPSAGWEHRDELCKSFIWQILSSVDFTGSSGEEQPRRFADLSKKQFKILRHADEFVPKKQVEIFRAAKLDETGYDRTVFSGLVKMGLMIDTGNGFVRTPGLHLPGQSNE